MQTAIEKPFQRSTALSRFGLAILFGIPVSAALAFLAVQVESRWPGPGRATQALLFGLIAAAALALLPLLTTSMEVIAGKPFLRIASSWDSLRGWQRGLLGTLVLLIACLAFGLLAGFVAVVVGS